MERKLTFKKGDKCVVAIKQGSNVSRYKDMSLSNIEHWTFDGEIISVGKKYIGVDFKIDNLKFVIEDDYINKWTRGGADYRLYKDIQEIKDERENEETWTSLQRFFGGWGKAKLPLEVTKEIYEKIKKYI